MPSPRLMLLPLLFLLLIVFLFVGYYSPPGIRPLYFGILLCTFVGTTQLTSGEERGIDYMFGTVGTACIHKAFHLLVVQTNVYEDYHWYDENSTSDRAPVKFKDLPLRQKCAWCVTHAFSARGIGLSWVIPHLPKAMPSNTRVSDYLLRTISQVCGYFFLQDIGRTYISTNPYIHSDGRYGTSISDTRGFGRCAIVVSLGLHAYAVVGMPLIVAYSIGMASGWFWTKPELNHPGVGRWQDAWTLRRFWGRVWHQTFRKPWQSIGQWVAWTILRAPKGSLVSRYAQVYVCFFLSASLHVTAGSIAYPDHASWARTWAFFLTQANGIVIEDFAQWVGKLLGLSETRWTRIAGGFWVLFWFNWTAAWFFDDLVQIGMVRPEPLPLSVIRGLWKGQWRLAST